MSGRVDITDKATCETAAGNIGFSDTTADEGSYPNAPPGCWRQSDGDLYYNKQRPKQVKQAIPIVNHVPMIGLLNRMVHVVHVVRVNLLNRMNAKHVRQDILQTIITKEMISTNNKGARPS